jgi:xanthine dehydrogenase accessory factor
VQNAALVPPEAWTSLLEKTPFALATLVEVPQSWSGPPAGSTVFLPQPERGASVAAERETTWDPELDRAAENAARSLFRSGRSGTEVVELGGSSVMVETFVPSTRLVVVGEALLAESIGAQAALLGWTSAVYGDMSDPAAADDVSGLRRSDALVVLSHDRSVDVPALELGLKAGCYVGALGSRHTQAARRERLLLLLDEAALDRIHGPVGLDLGARTPEEVALAICAEVLAHRSARSATSLREGTGPING